VAVSLQADISEWQTHGDRDWTAAKHFTRMFARQVLAEGLPGDVALISVNVPHGATPQTEVRRTRQSRRLLRYYVSKDFGKCLRCAATGTAAGDLRGPPGDEELGVSSPEATARASEAAAALNGGEAVAGPSAGDMASAMIAVLTQGEAVTRASGRLTVELARIALGRSALEPAKGDRRFSDPAWTANPVFRRIKQGYLASAQALNSVVDALGDSGADPRQAELARFAANVAVSAAAPTNVLAANPAAIKRAYETGGLSVLRGVRNFASDLRHNGGMPSMAPPGAFEVGRDLAVSPGAVIARDAVAEVLQYAPAADTVYERPVLVVPPPIGRFYFLDLRPGRSFVEYCSSQGLQTFMISWRNPTRDQGGWDLDTYARRLSDAIDSVREVTGSPDVNVVGFCAGGIITSTLLNHLAATGDSRVNSVSFAVTLLDFGQRAPINAFSGRRLLQFAGRRSRRKGIISARQMGSAFTWMRPDDLVFNYWVNNYLMGEAPPAFDILAWNADGTNLPGALHSQFLDIFADNLLVKPGGLTVLGTPLTLGTIKLPTFVTGAVTDHLTPWKGCYQTTQRLGGEMTFVLSYSGHIASLVNPPGNPKAHYWTGPAPGPDPDAWLAEADKHQGSWWEAWAGWVAPRSGERRPAPGHLGSDARPVLGSAPGLYVRDLPAS
jgi:polyhydroxyalkanoate synthase